MATVVTLDILPPEENLTTVEATAIADHPHPTTAQATAVATAVATADLPSWVVTAEATIESDQTLRD